MLLIGGLAAAVGTAHAAPSDEKSPLKAVQALVKAGEAMERGDCRTAVRTITPIVRRAEDLRDTPALLSMAWEALARCNYDGGDKEAAYAGIRHATAIAEATDAAWYFRMDMDVVGQRWPQVVETLEAMTQGRGGVLNAMSQRAISYVMTELRRRDLDDLRVRMLRVLANPSYSPTELMASTDHWQSEYAAHLFDTGDKDGARAIVNQLTSPSAVASASVDPRFRSAFPADPDIRSLYGKMLEDRQRLMRAHPNLLEPIISAASILGALGRMQEALEVLKSAETRIADPAAFADRAEQLSWWWDALSGVYEALGRYDDAVDAMQKGGALNEGQGPNVSQTINLAHLQLRIGRSEDAVRTLAAFDAAAGHDISPYGQMALRSSRACARAFTGRKAEALEDAAYMRARKLDAPYSLYRALACVGDMDAAAAALIELFDDPDRSATMLVRFGDYDAPPVARADNPLEKLEQALKARPDVQAAIARAGGVPRFRVQAGSF